MLLATFALWRRDIVRFYRQRSRIVGALGTPIVFWLLLGSGLGSSFRVDPTAAPEGGYLEYFFPGTLALIILFTAIFSTISVIEDRHEGFLQGVLVAPIPRTAIVLGKILGGTTLAVMQASLFLLLAPLANIYIGWTSLPMMILVLTTLAFSVTGLGFALAWILDSTQGFHAIMNVVLLPMWLLSGAVFPQTGASGWIQVIMFLNPMTYGVSAIRGVLAGGNNLGFSTSVWSSLILIMIFGIVTLAASTASVYSRRA
jgi:ABC-2 type transport system permease protein